MPEPRRQNRRRGRFRRVGLSVLGLGCILGWSLSCLLTTSEVAAVTDSVPQLPSTIRLGVPAFSFEHQSQTTAGASTARQPGSSGLAGTSGQPESSSLSETSGQPNSGRSSMVIQPRGAVSARPVSSSTVPTTLSQGVGRPHQTGQQAVVPGQPLPSDPSWQRLVTEEAVNLNSAELISPQQTLPRPPGPNPVRPQTTVPAVPDSLDYRRETQSTIVMPDSVVPQPSGNYGVMPPSAPGQPVPLQLDHAQNVIDGSNDGSQEASPLGAHSMTGPPDPAPAISGHSVYTAAPGMSGYRATVEVDANRWISPYSQRANLADVSQPEGIVPRLDAMPSDFRPWWDQIVRQPLNSRAATMQVNVSNLLQDALLYSPQVVAIQAEPEVKYRLVTQEAARFDWTAFLESTYNDLNDPVGNELTTGTNEDRLLTRNWRFSGGLRRRNQLGGEVQVTQDFGHENQNSRFFIPNNQASSRLELSYRQPLLDGAGRAYNQSEIVLARIDANASEDDVVDALQDHLIDVTSAYWTLYRARSEFFQRQKLLMNSTQVLNRLEGRAQVDTIPRQVLRARAAVARAKTGIRRTLARVKDAEAQLRLLVNAPGMLNGGPTELLPLEPPVGATESADLRSILQTALYNRADISGAIRQMRAAGVRLGVSQQELLPRLDMLVSTYVADLSGGSDLGTAIRGKYVDNRPGYTVGLEFEFPLGNRAARARNEQRQWELKRAINIFRATVEKSLTDVEIGRRDVETAHAEMISRYHSMVAAEQESAYLKDRFDVLPEAEESATLLLEDLLDSFERLADEESAFVGAQIDHALSLINLKKQLGTLLRSRHDRPAIDSAQKQWVQDRLHTRTSEIQNQLDATSEAQLPRSRPGNQAQPLPAAQNSGIRGIRQKTSARSGSQNGGKHSVVGPEFKGVQSASFQRSAGSGSKVMKASAQKTSHPEIPQPHQTKWIRSPLNGS